MRAIICLVALCAIVLASSSVSGEQQRILRRVIKSTPTATNLGRIRLVHIRSANVTATTSTTTAPPAEKGAVAEISSKEAASFGQRSANETAASQQQPQQSKGKQEPAQAQQTASPATTTTTTSTSTTPASTSTSTTTAASAGPSRQAAALQPGAEVELLSSAPSSWQAMTAVEAPAAMLIATGVRAASAASSSDLSSSSSTLHSSEESTGDFLRSAASGTKGAASYTRQSDEQQFSRIQSKQQQQQQSFFYPQQTRQTSSKTSNIKSATKTHWYQPAPTTARPAPLIQEQYVEQQNEQYVEQVPQQVEYGAAPLGAAEPFAFDFKTQDNSGNGQYRKEESDKNGVVRGSYGYTDANGIYRHVEYIADQNGFRANIKSNEPGLIGETQPASIQYSGGPAPSNPQRLSAPSVDQGDWTSHSSSNNNQEFSGDLVALAPPNFESSHKSDRIRAPRNYRS